MINQANNFISNFEYLRNIIREEEIALVLGAGIHGMNEVDVQAEKIITARKTLRDWDYFINHAAHEANVEINFENQNHLSPTLKWELIINRIKGASAADEKERYFIDIVQRLILQNEKIVLDSLNSYSPLLEIIRHPAVKHIVSLNIDLVVETFLRKSFGPFRSIGRLGIERHSSFNDLIIWHPHGDRKNKETITFGLRQYSNTLKEVEKARQRFKLNEYTQSTIKPTSWIDLFMSKPLLFIGTSLNQAEWDIWFALVNRWRNYGREKSNEKPVFVLTRNDNHKHLPSDKFNLLPCQEYDEGWAMLTTVFR